MIKWIIEFIRRIMNPQSTDKIFVSTNKKQYKIVYRSPNNLPNTPGASGRTLHMYDSSSGLLPNGVGYDLEANDYLINFNFASPLIFDAWVKLNQSGKQTLVKSPSQQVSPYSVGGITHLSFGIIGEQTDVAVNSAELFMVAYSLVIHP